jgi:biotin-(acetyl-CoA carboxylase) ligase
MYAVALGVVRGVERELPQLRDVLRIKWPNDVYVLRPLPIKIGGVLVQSSSIPPSPHTASSPSFRLVAGVGLNIHNSHPTTCLADLGAPADPPPVTAALAAAVFDEVVRALRQLDDGGLRAIQHVRCRSLFLFPSAPSFCLLAAS